MGWEMTMTFRTTRWALAAVASTLALASGAAHAAQAPSITPTPDMSPTATQISPEVAYFATTRSSFPVVSRGGAIVGSAGGSQHDSLSDGTNGQAAESVSVNTATQTIDVKASASRSVDSTEAFTASVAGGITYYLTVTGPTTGAQDVVVPLHLIGAYLLTGETSSLDGRFSAGVQYDLSGGLTVTGGSQDFSAFCGTSTPCGGGVFSTDFTLPAYAGGQDGNTAQIFLYASADSIAADNANVGGEVSTEAFLDPKITIDADWLAANPGFQVNFSENIENGAGVINAGVPEPASWALMIAGFGLAGAALRRRRPVAA
jgi:hypothetical protein